MYKPVLCCLLLFLLSGCGRSKQKASLTVESGSSLPATLNTVPEAGSTLSPAYVPDVTPPRDVQPAAKSKMLSQEQLRAFELSAIMAHRQQFPSHVEIDPPSSPPVYPFSLLNLDPNLFQLRVQKQSFEEFPQVTINAGNQSTEKALETVLEAGCDVDYGIQFSLYREIDGELNLLLKAGRETQTPVHLNFESSPLTTAACEVLGQLSNLRSLQLTHCQLDDEKFKLILQNKQIEILSLVSPGDDLSLSAICEVNTLPKLKSFKLKNLSTQTPQGSIDPLYKVLSTCPELESIHIEEGTASQGAISSLLKGCDRSRLRYLYVDCEPLNLWNSEGFDRCPNLEDVNIAIATSRSDYVAYFLSSIRRGGGKKLRTLTIRLPKDYFIPSSRAGEVFARLQAFPNLETIRIPFKVQHASHLEALTRLDRLRTISLDNVNVDREMLMILCRMPHLEHLSAKSLKFGNESAHLVPWLNIKSLYVEHEETITDTQVRLLASCPRLHHFAYWSDHGGIPHDVQMNYPHIQFQEYD